MEVNGPFEIPYPPRAASELAAAQRLIEQLRFALGDMLVVHCPEDHQDSIVDMRARELLRMIDDGTPASTATIATHELARLIESDRLIAYLTEKGTYLEDGRKGVEFAEYYWSVNDESRPADFRLREYIACRLAGEVIPMAPIPDGIEPYHPASEDIAEDRMARQSLDFLKSEPKHYAGLLDAYERTDREAVCGEFPR